MRARMYYMRDRVGKQANKVKEKRIWEARKAAQAGHTAKK